jgi:hypothetical protein
MLPLSGTSQQAMCVGEVRQSYENQIATRRSPGSPGHTQRRDDGHLDEDRRHRHKYIADGAEFQCVQANKKNVVGVCSANYKSCG